MNVGVLYSYKARIVLTTFYVSEEWGKCLQQLDTQLWEVGIWLVLWELLPGRR